MEEELKIISFPHNPKNATNPGSKKSTNKEPGLSGLEKIMEEKLKIILFPHNPKNPINPGSEKSTNKEQRTWIIGIRKDYGGGIKNYLISSQSQKSDKYRF